MVNHVLRGEAGEKPLGAADLGLLDGLEVQRLHRALGLGNEEDVLHHALVEGNGPVRGVVAHGRRDGEALRQLCIDTDFFCQVHVLCHAPLHALTVLGIAVRKDVILDVLLRTVRPGEVAVLLGGEDGAVVGSLRAAVGDLLNDHRGLLLIDESDSLDDEFLRVVAEHGKLIGADAVQNPCRAAPGELGPLRDLADQVIGHLTA